MISEEDIYLPTSLGSAESVEEKILWGKLSSIFKTGDSQFSGRAATCCGYSEERLMI